MKLVPLGLALGLSSCAESVGELDPGRVAEIARSRGDGDGSQYQASYILVVTESTCDCAVDGLAQACAVLDESAGFAGPATVVQASDGFMVTRIAPIWELTGAVDGDGAVDLGQVIWLASAGVHSAQVSRLQGEFSPLGFTAELATQWFGEVAGAREQCDAWAAVSGYRLP